MITPCFLPRACLGAVLALLMGHQGLVHAQSGYTLTVLKSPNLKPISPQAIDAQNRVLGTVEYFTGYGLLPDFSRIGALYAPYLVRWPASTAASVSGVKVVPSQPGGFKAASADGSKVILDLALAYDANTGKPLGFGDNLVDDTGAPIASHIQWVGIGNDGTAIGLDAQSSYEPDHQRPVRWATAGRVARIVPFAGYVGAKPTGVNAQGTVSGLVFETGALPVMRAAVWTQGDWQVIDRQAGRGSVALSVNVAGQVLMRTMPVVQLPGVAGLRYGPAVAHVVSSQGAELPITALKSGEVAVATSMNASGTVVGRMGAIGVQAPYQVPNPLDPARVDAPAGRAFIWRNGVTTDLTTWVTGKGVKLPTGAVLDAAIAINDQGAILSRMRDARGAFSYVRLTAKP